MGLPIFTENDDITSGSLREAVMQLNARLRSLENQLYSILTSLDSSNLAELDLDDITLRSKNGSQISGDMIKLCGGDEGFEAGYDKNTGQFVFNLPFGMTVTPSEDGTSLNIDTVTAKKLVVSCGDDGLFDVGYDASTKQFQAKLVNYKGTTKFSY